MLVPAFSVTSFFIIPLDKLDKVVTLPSSTFNLIYCESIVVLLLPVDNNLILNL